MASEAQYDYKLYIEGIEVPFTAANITTSVNQMSQASIQIPPTRSARLIRPRSLVHIFFRDDYRGPLPFGEFQSESVWRLLWEGEIMGYSYTKGTQARQITLRCQDFISYWASTMQYQLSADQAAFQRAQRKLIVGSKRANVSIISILQEYFVKTFSAAGTMPEAIVGIVQRFTEQLVHFADINARIKLDKKIKLLDDAETEFILKKQNATQLIRGISGNSGGKISLLQFINNMKQLIFYTHCPVVAPPFDSKNGSTSSIIFKPQIHQTIPPRCNCFFPDMITNLTFGRSFLSEPTRLLMATNTVWSKSDLHNALYMAPAALNDDLQSEVNANWTGGRKYTEEEKKALEEAAARAGSSDVQATSPLLEEELEKGIIGIEVGLPYPQITGQSSREDRTKDMQAVAEYQLQVGKANTRSITMGMQFNPWPVVGFPCAVFDAIQSFFGHVVNISHNISTQGGSFTQIDCNLAREMIPDDSTEYVYIPKWMNKKYRPESLLGPEGNYRSLLGCDGMYAGSKDTSGGHAALADARGNPLFKKDGSKLDEAELAALEQYDLAKIADGLYTLLKPNPLDPDFKPANGEWDLAEVRGDSWRFGQEYVRRNVATMAQVFGSMYNLGFTDDKEPAPSSVPVGSSRDEPVLTEGRPAGKSPLNDGVFDYRPRDKEVKVIAERERAGNEILASKVPGHKRVPIWDIREEILEGAVDGS
jgi:hypothetical protein